MGYFQCLSVIIVYGLSLVRVCYHLRNNEIVILIPSCRAEGQSQFLSHFPLCSRHVLLFLSYTEVTPFPTSFHGSRIPQTVTPYEKLQFPLFASVFVVPESSFLCNDYLMMTAHKIQRRMATTCFSLGDILSLWMLKHEGDSEEQDIKQPKKLSVTFHPCL